MEGLDLTQQAESNLSEKQPFIAIEVDRDKAAAAGLTELAIGGIVAEAMLPTPVRVGRDRRNDALDLHRQPERSR